MAVPPGIVKQDMLRRDWERTASANASEAFRSVGPLTKSSNRRFLAAMHSAAAKLASRRSWAATPSPMPHSQAASRIPRRCL